ncbi:HAG group protein [Heterostelium album PN500]|uniref:HAG group protein n=1 Tax=Heterostelium pallidum (strain ATCC 26659 / Pp 5 / PN500) TaxID=670386 RepID=D3B4B0_HETP5|nr:HAG group protein [Heterostelium album PN500]EFA84158.1 HAG group protein [Heterostelium album PN500]|eukprot:XP_020436275.1 HAG group protein [Heterostelium album PN500]
MPFDQDLTILDQHHLLILSDIIKKNMEPTTNTFEIRPANKEDIPRVHELIKELAEYEKLSHMVIGTAEDLEKFSFGEHKVVHVYCGWSVQASGESKLIGYTLHFLNYSTFLHRPGIYLEDIYIQPEFRSKGYGKKMLLHLCKIAKDNGYGRVEWQVLDWNKPSIDFYESLGAKPMKEWIQYRLVGDGITQCAINFDKLNV